MMMPGRTYSAQSSYRYGFNGKENDSEVKGEGNQQDYGMRVYDPRLGKFLSVDPLTKKYPMLTPYQFASNRPMDGIDLDGLEYLDYRTSMYRMQAITKSTLSFEKGMKLVTTDDYVVNTVYSNIPRALQDPQTNSFKFVGDGPVTAYGRDWDQGKDGLIFIPYDKYYHGNGPRFYGLPADANPEPSDAMKPVGSYYGDDPMWGSSKGAKANAIAGALAEGIAIAQNFSNGDEWGAIGQERKLRWGFYDATNTVDSYIKNNNISNKSLTSGRGRADLVNFMADGTLPINNRARNNNTRKNMYAHALDVAFTGVQLMKQQGILRKETISAINSTLKKYKKVGGGNEYDNISKYMNQ